MRAPRLARAAAGAVTLALAAAPAAQAGAPGWSTPHTVTPYAAGTYGAGPNGQAVQLFGVGGAQSRTAQMRAITQSATQGSAVGVDAGRPGFDFPEVSVNATGQLVAAWTLDTETTAPIGLAAALGSRNGLPRAASVLPTQGSVADLATAITTAGVGIVAWIELPATAGPTLVKAATLRPGQAPQTVTLSATTNPTVGTLSVGVDSASRPIVTWGVASSGVGVAPQIAVARGDGSGGFAAAVAYPVAGDVLTGLQTFVVGAGTLVALWVDGTPGVGTPAEVMTASAPAGAAFGSTRGLISGDQGRGQIVFAADAAGRIAVLFPEAASGGTTLTALLRTTSGTWGGSRVVGPTGRYVNRTSIGVEADGRVVALWDDGASRSTGATRILTARSGSSTGPLGSYHQLGQRSGDRRCDQPTLYLSTSGHGLGQWDCSTSSSGAIESPRLARLTAAS